MRLVANGTDTRIPADVTTCKMAAAHDAASRSREIGTWTWRAPLAFRYHAAIRLAVMTSDTSVTCNREENEQRNVKFNGTALRPSEAYRYQAK